jgi:hypothetical protein
MSNIKNLIMKYDELKTTVDFYKLYTKYLKTWYREHLDPKYEQLEPMNFNEFCSVEIFKHPGTTTYKVRVTINESSHIINDYYDVINVLAPRDLEMHQLKEYIKTDSKYSIEDLVEPTADTKDVVCIEIYDFDLELLEAKENS